MYPSNMLELDQVLEFDPSHEGAFFGVLPARPGVLLIEMADPGAQPYLARTANIRSAAERLLRDPEIPSKRLNLRAAAARVRYRPTGSKFEQLVTHYEQARAHFPRRYRDVVRIRPPAMLKVNLRNEYPRCYVTRTIRGDEGFYFGPFASRKAAEGFSGEFLDLFKLRRCQIKILRDPGFPGCMYSQMKMCLAPCFAGCSKEQYDAEVGRVLAALKTAGAQLTQEVEREREAASEALDFERAAGIHKRLEKIAAVLRGLPEVARSVTELDAVIIQCAAEERTIAVFPVLAGILRRPIFLRFGELSSEPRSVEAILRAGLQVPRDEPATTVGSDNTQSTPENEEKPPRIPEEQGRSFGLLAAPAELTEHLWLLARWFYSNPREGEIFFREAAWPYRRILRGCARLLAQPPVLADSAKPASGPSRDQIRRLKSFSKMKHRAN